MAAEIIMNDKEMLRTLMEEERIAALTPEQIASADEAIMDKLRPDCCWQQAQTVFLLSGSRAIATLPLLRAALAAGKRIAAPLITSPGIMEARLMSDLADLHPDRYGIPAPPPDG